MLNNFLKKSCRLWDNVERFCTTGQPWMKMWHIYIACWVQKATNALSQCVILIVFWLQQWLHKCASLLRYSTLPVLLYIPWGPRLSQKCVAQFPHYHQCQINSETNTECLFYHFPEHGTRMERAGRCRLSLW